MLGLIYCNLARLSGKFIRLTVEKVNRFSLGKNSVSPIWFKIFVLTLSLLVVYKNIGYAECIFLMI